MSRLYKQFQTPEGYAYEPVENVIDLDDVVEIVEKEKGKEKGRWSGNCSHCWGDVASDPCTCRASDAMYDSALNNIIKLIQAKREE